LKNLQEWDLAVAGAGPAGCALAAKVAQRGGRVLLLESRERPGEGREWIVDVEKPAFDAAAVPRPAPGALWKEPEKTVIVSPSREHSVELPPTPLVPVRNGEYVRQLASWAVESGARLRTGVTVEGPIIESGAVIGVTLDAGGKRESVTASVTADCTGISGSVRRATPPEWRLCDKVGPSETVRARREIREIDRGLAEAAVREGRLRNRIRTDRTGAHGAYSVESFYLDIEGGFADILLGIKPSGSLPSADERFEELVGEMGFVRGRSSATEDRYR
jgi:flavin-dependent dehydrogenase